MQLHLTPSDIERFWSKVDKNGPNGCWLWTASKNGKGYGKFGLSKPRGSRYAHRISYMLAYSVMPNTVHHTCGCKSCCNPDHLENVDPRTHGKLHRWESCIHGHAITPENTYVVYEKRKGYAVSRCRECRLESKRRQYAARLKV